MNIIIHRGNDQIGGCITEISTAGCRILIDFGTNLPGSDREDYSQEEIDRLTDGVDAIFYTHYHGDHTGMHHRVPRQVKQYIGQGAKEVMGCKYRALSRYQDFSRELEAVERMIPFKERDRISIQDKIVVIPYFVSHSAFASYLFRIECEGKVILHTGDFRGHGFLGKGLLKIYRAYLRHVDVLITEGTMLGRAGEPVLKESEIERNTIRALNRHKYIFALCSSTDIDRLASFHQACKRTHRLFLTDGYQKSVLDIFSQYAGTKSPLFDFDEVTTLKFDAATIHQLITRGFLMPIRMSSLKLLQKMKGFCRTEEPWLIYSMWSGYAQAGKSYSNEDVQDIRACFGDRILDGTKDGFHTSGHADIETLQAICRIASPRLGIIPIHKDKDSRYENLPVAADYKVFGPGTTETDGVKIVIK